MAANIFFSDPSSREGKHVADLPFSLEMWHGSLHLLFLSLQLVMMDMLVAWLSASDQISVQLDQCSLNVVTPF